MKKSLVCALIVFVLITAISVCSVFAAGVFSKEESVPCLACGETLQPPETTVGSIRYLSAESLTKAENNQSAMTNH